MNEHSILDTARNAYNAGLCPIRAAVDGTKRPLGQWKKYQTDRPELIEIDEWFSDWPNLGLVCGQVSGRLECLDFEGRFMDEVGMPGILTALGPLANLFDAWCGGYAERTPNGGLHVFVRLEGSGPLPGNTKIAMGPDSETLIETRGEGGFIVVAPSNGATHPSGQAWTRLLGGFDSIAYATLDEWQSVLDALGQYDRSPPAPVPPPITRRLTLVGDSWVNEALGQLDMTTELVAAGWTYVRSDHLGQLWRRPGKNLGVSARVNLSGRLHVFSTSTPLGAGRTTYDALDVRLAYRYGRSPTRDERVEELRPMRAEAKDLRPPPAQFLEAGGHQEAAPAETSLLLPSAFWQQRPILAHIYQASMHRRVCPDAVLNNVMALHLACVPPTFMLPDSGSLNYIGMVVAPSGSGKSMAFGLASELMPVEALDISGVAFGMPPGTGEGYTQAYLKKVKEQGTYKNVQVMRGIHFYADEGQIIHNLRVRSGNTTIAAMKQAWSGNLTGQTNATEGLARFLPRNRARFTMTISVTPDDAAGFLATDLADGGFPQRLVWSWGQHPDLPSLKDRPPWPGRLDLPLLENFLLGQTIEPDDAVLELTDDALVASRRGEPTDQHLDGHIVFSTLKVAAVLALWDERFTLSMSDWDLATQIMSTSRTVRAHLLARQTGLSLERHRSSGRNRAIADEAADQYRMMKAVDQLVRVLEANDGVLSVKQVKDSLRALSRRYGIHHQTVLEYGFALGKVVKDPMHGIRLRGGVKGGS